MFLLEFIDVFIAVLEVHFGLFRTLRQAFEHAVGELAVGDEALQLIDAWQRNLLHASYIGEGGFGSHLSVGNDMRDVRLAVLTADIIQHFASSAVFEIGIYIRQGNTVGIEETLEQQVVLERVEVGYLQAVRHYGAGRRTTSRTDGHIQFFACRTDEVHDDEEITRETHRDDGIEFELDALFEFLVVLQPLLAVTLQGSLHRQMAQVRGLEGQTVGIVLFLSERSGDVELRHDRVMVDIIYLHFIDYLLGVGERFGDIAEDGLHLRGCLEPLLLGVVHSVDIVDEMVGAEADKAVVRLGVLFVDEMTVVGGNKFDVVFMRQLDEHGVHLFLPLIDLHVCAGFLRLMALEFDIIVLAKEGLEPLDGLFRFGKHTLLNLCSEVTPGSGLCSVSDSGLCS